MVEYVSFTGVWRISLIWWFSVTADNKMEVVYIITLELLTAQLLIYFNRLFLLD